MIQCFDIISSSSRDHLLGNLNFIPFYFCSFFSYFLYVYTYGNKCYYLLCEIHPSCTINFSAITIMQLSLKGNCVEFRPLFIPKNTNILFEYQGKSFITERILIKTHTPCNGFPYGKNRNIL